MRPVVDSPHPPPNGTQFFHIRIRFCHKVPISEAGALPKWVGTPQLEIMDPPLTYYHNTEIWVPTCSQLDAKKYGSAQTDPGFPIWGITNPHWGPPMWVFFLQKRLSKLKNWVWSKGRRGRKVLYVTPPLQYDTVPFDS